jgi:hypothetical protein
MANATKILLLANESLNPKFTSIIVLLSSLFVAPHLVVSSISQTAWTKGLLLTCCMYSVQVVHMQVVINVVCLFLELVSRTN